MLCYGGSAYRAYIFQPVGDVFCRLTCLLRVVVPAFSSRYRVQLVDQAQCTTPSLLPPAACNSQLPH